jgi:apolipoprotein N-acyltransferase
MASALNYRRGLVGLLAVVCTAALFWFGNDLNPWWPLMWFAPLPVLLFASRGSWWGAAIVAFLSLMAGSFVMWRYFHLLGAPFVAWLSVYLIAALVFAAAVLLFRALLRRGALWSALLALPATWVSYEYIRNLTTPHGTAGSFAYTQLNFLPFLQLASITGPWGMSFLLLLFSSALAIGWYARKRARWVVATSLAIIVAVLIFGGIRLALPQSGPKVRMGLVASDSPANMWTAPDGEKTRRLFRDYADVAATLAARGAQIIVMPEKIGTVSDSDASPGDAGFQLLADKTNATIVAGLVHVSSPVEYNEARVYAPGAPLQSYDKEHMLPPFESKLKPGTTITWLSKRAQRCGVAICKDFDFTSPSRRYGVGGAGLMLAPAWDFTIDRWWHGHIAIMRGVEDGFSLARSAKNGYLTVSDNRGRVVAEVRSDSAPFATLISDVPAAHSKTVYLLLGDWVAWLALALLVFTLVQLYRIRNNFPPLY